jgi:carboxymethylenebutenolidase
MNHYSKNFLKLVFATLAGLAVIASPAAAQDWAKERVEKSPRHMEYVTVKHGKRAVECFVAYPEVADKAQAVVVIHDISAFGDWIRSVADQLAEAGYIAVVPDLLSGMGKDGGGTDSFESIDDARRKVSALPAKQVTADLNAATEYATKLPASNGKVSVAGFCWGGGQTLRYATNNPKLSAAFVFYGYEPIVKSDVERVHCPIYGFYAENDARINASLADVKRLMKEAKKTFEPVTYAGAGHGFMRHGEDPAGTDANKKAREDAWKRWKEILSAETGAPKK